MSTVGIGAQDPRRRYVDTSTRFPGIYARHSLYCDLGLGRKRCTCKPSYWGKVWDRDIGRHRKTAHLRSALAARNARDDLRAQVRKEAMSETSRSPRFEDARREFIADCRASVALNRYGRPYTRKAIVNLDSSLGSLPSRLRSKRMDDVTSFDMQVAVDGLQRRKRSSSRIKSIVSSTSAFYGWAIARGKARANPVDSVRLPASDSKERDRVATPGEFVALLDALEAKDALPWALAGYGTARLQEIQVLEWPEVDLEHGAMLLAGNEEARKSKAARRIVPLLKPLRRRLRAEWVRQGRPKIGKVCPPRRRSRSGLVSLNQLSKRVMEKWDELGMRPIGLQDSRHTAATWLDHSGVAPKVASVFMGHKAPRAQSGAAPITLRRYTHVLPGELERARDLLDGFLVEREARERDDPAPAGPGADGPVSPR